MPKLFFRFSSRTRQQTSTLSSLGMEHLEERLPLAYDLVDTLHSALPTPSSQTFFGSSIATSDDYVVIGSAGGNRVEVLSTEYEPIVQIPAPSTQSSFGTSIAIEGSLLVVGASTDDTFVENGGAVYVYDLAADQPTIPVATIPNPRASAFDGFGQDIDLHENTLVVGANRERFVGAAYIYDLASDSTEPLFTIDNPSPVVDDFFGSNVAVHDSMIVVAASSKDTEAGLNDIEDTGAVYLYEISGGELSAPVELGNPNPTESGRFGQTVEIDGNSILVGSSRDDSLSNNAGRVFVYDRTSVNFDSPDQTIDNPDVGNFDSFGNSIVQNGEKIAVSGFNSDADQGRSVFVFDLNTGSMERLNHPSPNSQSRFGGTIAFNDSEILISDSVDGSVGSLQGAVFVYRESVVAADFNGDEVLDCQDINALGLAIVEGDNNSVYDLNGDSLVDRADRDAWLQEAGRINLGQGFSYINGDMNLDGAVDTIDFDIWVDHKFTVGNGWCAGDLNVDGLVDVSDFNIWSSNKFSTVNRVSAATESSQAAPRYAPAVQSAQSAVQSNSIDRGGRPLPATPRAAARTIPPVMFMLPTQEHQRDLPRHQNESLIDRVFGVVESTEESHFD